MIYTYYKRRGDSILFSYIDENGKTVDTTIRDYKPTLYLKTEEDTGLKSIYGHYVRPIKTEGMRDANELMNRYQNVDDMAIEGNTRFDNQFVIELYEGEDIEYDESLIKGCFIDIEVTAPEFPTPEHALYEVDLITLYNTKNKQYTTFSLHDYDPFIEESEAKELNEYLTFIKCESEEELLRKFVHYLQSERFHYISGWNSSGFDMPYLVNRIEKELGREYVLRMSPFRQTNTRMSHDSFGNDMLRADIMGLPDLDYMLLYRKHIYTPRENYKLDTICEAELGTNKLSYEEEGTLYNLSKQNPQKYVAYNLIDVRRMVQLEEKLNLFPLTFTLSYLTFSNYEDTLGTVGMWECYIARELYKDNMVPPARDANVEYRNYVGAFVLDPQVGKHEWVVSFDFNSLYPHIEMQLNISPETHIPRTRLPKELRDLQDKLAVRNAIDYHIQCQNLVRKEVDLSCLKKYNVSMSASGQFYTRDYVGVIPRLNDHVYSSRVKARKELRQYRNELAKIETELKKRGVEL